MVARDISFEAGHKEVEPEVLEDYGHQYGQEADKAHNPHEHEEDAHYKQQYHYVKYTLLGKVEVDIGLDLANQEAGHDFILFRWTESSERDLLLEFGLLEVV